MESGAGVNKKKAVEAWWAANPQTYGDVHGQTDYTDPSGERSSVALGTREGIEAADQTFYSWNRDLHRGGRPFARVFDYDRYAGQRVLEVGCGLGCMAMNWAQNGARVTAVDLNPVSVAMTRRRLGLFGLTGDVLQMDGERLSFADDSFDFVYSWGVLHHSQGTKRSIDELHRVLKPGGSAAVMLYGRESCLYRYMIQYVEGFLHMERSFLTPLELASRYTDGYELEGNPHTWPITRREAREVLFERFDRVRVDSIGGGVDAMLNRWFPRLGSHLMPRPLLRALDRRVGWSLWITGAKGSGPRRA